MDNIERKFFHLRQELLAYKQAGIDHKQFQLCWDYVQSAEKAYQDFKKETGILGLYKGG